MITYTEIPNSGGVTVWNDVQNLQQYVSNPATDLFRPQYTIEGNKITFRGLMYVPLIDAVATSIDVSTGNSYLTIPSANIDESRVSVVSNANSNNGTPQARFFTPSVTTLPNLPTNATPLSRDILFNQITAFRRFSNGSIVTNYRTIVDLRVCSNATTFRNGSNLGIGCIMILSPFSSEYDGSGNPPSGNDPLGLLISRANVDDAINDYIGATDNSPFTVGAGLGTSPFSVNAHNIVSLGGFIVPLEGLSGYLK